MGVYERFFKLHDEPFRLTPDPRYLFLSGKHREVLAHLRLGASESSGFVCITGDIGTGKTTLIRSFLEQLEPGTAYAYLFNPPRSPLELLQTINTELGLSSIQTSRKALMDTLNAFLLSERRAGRRALVVVDEAQALPPEVLEELRLLSNLETSTAKLVQIVLFGQPQLADLLCSADLSQLNQRITLRWHLGPLDTDETASYVRHRLRVAAGGVERTIFSKRALKRIHSYSGGVPRVINVVAHRCLLAAYAADRPRITTRVVDRVHDEIQRVPLLVRTPKTATRWRRAAWIASGTALAAALGWASVRLGVDFGSTWASRDHAKQSAAVAAAVAEVPPPMRESDPAPTEAPPTRDLPPPSGRLAMLTAESPPPTLDPPFADGNPASDNGGGDAAQGTQATRLPADEVASMLGALPQAASTVAAIDAVLSRWQEAPLAPHERPMPIDLDAITAQRDLRHLSISGTINMLRVLNLPAILELAVPGPGGPRYAMLAGVDGKECLLGIDGRMVQSERTFLDEFWLGQAHVIWRDFERLAPTFGKGSIGPRVRRLQQMLADLSLYTGSITGVFDDRTELAVASFQRSKRLFADAIVGQLTRITLYGSVGGYEHPRLLVTDTNGTEADA